MSNHSSHTLGRGYIQVYTGNNKGKTTAAIGLAFRGAGYGLKTHIGQFMKGQPTGELETAKMVQPYITIEQYGRPGWVRLQDSPENEDRQLAKKGIQRSKDAMLSGDYDIIVLDEINTAYHFKLVTLEEMMEMILDKPDGVELVFTGRYAPSELIMEADLVTEMSEVKHYFRKGVQSRDGIER